MDILHTTIAIVLAVVLIIRFKVDPVISLVIACLYLGLLGGLGLDGTIGTITGGFGSIMAEVGLLIGFGVLIGALLESMGTFRDLVQLIARRLAGRLPYAMTAVLTTIFPSIYVDVQVVLAAPVARSSAPVVARRNGLPLMAGAVGTGIFSGYVFVIPGLAALIITGQLGISLGTWLIYGLVIGLATALLTTFLFRLLLRTGFWKTALDEEADDEGVGQASAEDTDDAAADPGARNLGRTRFSLLVRLTPILVPLVLIAGAALADLFEVSNAVIVFLGDANLALFVGLLMAFVLARMSQGTDGSDRSLSRGFHTTGEILLITGVGGSLGAVIAETGLEETLGGLFSAEGASSAIVSLLLAWAIAAVMHLAIGSVSVAAITASGIIAPVLAQAGASPLEVGLAIASGALFAVHVNSNFFWMFKALHGLTTRGALKTLTLVTSMASVVSLPMVMAVSLFT